MEENTKIEQIQNLDEEQLQAIAGGCRDCVQKVVKANEHLRLVLTYNDLSYKAKKRPRPKTAFAKLAENLANGHEQASHNLINEVRATGHLPDELLRR